MKYSNKIKTPWRFSMIIFLSVFALLTGILIAMLIAFPIQLSSKDMQMNSHWYSKLLVFWPEPALKHELSERKKIKRYSKAEIQRRLEKQLKIMSFLNTPLYDLWLDKNLEIITSGRKNTPDDASFFWPVLPKSSHAIDNVNAKVQNRSSYFVVLPDLEKVIFRKGTYLGSGESIRSNIPVSNSKRYLMFEALPLAPGYLKIVLGQYVWTKNFSENEIHKPTKFFVPINDSLAQNYKLSNVSSSLYLLELKVVSITPNAREPIYISKNSDIWRAHSEKTPELDNTDPLNELSNQSLLFERDTALAKGYNTIFISIDDLNADLFANEKKISKLMPHLYEFANRSFVIINKLNMQENLDDKFKTPTIYKKYGYKTAIFTNAETVQLPDSLTSFPDFSKISKSWLVDSDVHLQQQINAKDANKREPEGLNAVFKTQTEEQLQPIDRQKFKNLASYLKLLSSYTDEPNNLVFDDNLIVSEKNYVPNLIDAFQKWSTSQAQNRLFIDLKLSTNASNVRTSIQDLIFALTKSPTLNFKKLHEYMKMHSTDQEFKQIIDTLQVRYIAHRTIVIAVLKNKDKPENSSALIFIPGLMSKNKVLQSQINLRDLMLYSMSVVGIPLETAVNFADTYKNPETNQTIRLNASSNQENTENTKYNLIVYPDQNNCASFTWRATNGPISNIKSNYPFYQAINSNTLEFFPCSFGEKALEIEWNQQSLAPKTDTNLKLADTNHVYGYFLPQAKNIQSVEVYYGKNLINHINFPFNFKHTPDQMESIFLGQKKEIDHWRTFTIRSLETMRLDSNIAHKTQAALLISKVHSK